MEIQSSLKDIAAGVTPYVFIICLDYVLQTSIDLMKENGYFYIKKRQAADNTQKKLLQMQTMQMT